MIQIYATEDPAVTKRELDHAALARAVAGECAVLLENDGTLPLHGTGKLALYGSGARRTVRGGTGSGDVNVRDSVSAEQGLINAGFEITTGDWLARMDMVFEEKEREYRIRMRAYAREQGISEQHAMFTHPFQVPAPPAVTDEDVKMSGADTAVYVLARISGEGADRRCRRGDYLLYEEERAQLELLGRVYERVILVLNTGGVMDLGEAKNIAGVGAVLLMGQLGSAGGSALADLLTGRVNPSGKLADTWAKRYEDYPASATFSANDGNVDDEYYTEGVYVGYRFFDTFRVKPLYPFGYGLSYTEFEIAAEEVKAEKGTVEVSVTVKNTGAAAGKEVVQVYCAPPAGLIPKPRKSLIGFQKTGLLRPGGRETLKISCSVREMASYSEREAAWVLEAGEYVLYAGNSSADTHPAAVLVLERTVTVEKLGNLFEDADPVREIKAPAFPDASGEAPVRRILLRAEEIPARCIEYQKDRPVLCAREIAAGRAGDQETCPVSDSERAGLLSTEEIAAGHAGYQKMSLVSDSERAGILTAEDVRAGRCTVGELVSQLSVEEMAQLCVGTLRMDGGSVVGNASAAVPGAAGDTSAVLFATRRIRSMILADGPAGLRLEPVFYTDREGRVLPGTDPQNPLSTRTDGCAGGTAHYQYCTQIPVGWALAQSFNLPLLEEAGSLIGREMELFGVDLWLAPAMNIHRDPLCGRNFEYYSEDPLVSGRTAAAITRGVQSHRGKGVTIKHFAANSQEDNRYFTNSHVSERALREIYLRGFEIAVRESDPMAVMTSYNLLNGTHTANHRDLLQAVLRDEWGFEGVVMSDWFTSQDQTWSIGAVKTQYPISSSVGCIWAGNDIQMPGCQKNVDDIVTAVREGTPVDGYRITIADLQQSAAAVVRAALRVSEGDI